MIVWKKEIYKTPPITLVAEALRTRQNMLLSEDNFVFEPRYVIEYYGPLYRDELKSYLPSSVNIPNAIQTPVDENKYIINPFLTSLEKYLAKAKIAEDIVKGFVGKESDYELMATNAIDPRDLYLRTISYGTKDIKWTLDHQDFLDAVNGLIAKGKRWSFCQWRPKNECLYYGNIDIGTCYTVEEIIAMDKIPDKEDLLSLVEAGNKYIDYNFDDLIDVLKS